ncbi:hypothetical protein Lser_V15G36638 [Lactuca serriola]
MLSKFRHGHIVSLLGYHEGSDKREMILVYEYMPNGSLEDHLHKRRANGSKCSLLTWVQRLNICIGAARGLDYLHSGTSLQSTVIHRDIKSSNILLDEKLAAKISDFGLSTIGPANQVGTTNVYTNQIRGTFGYIDSEYYTTRRLTRKSDVYAFGVVLLEVLCGRPALDFTLGEEQHSLAVWAKDCIKEGKIDRIIDPCLRGKITANCLKEFGRIASECILTRSKDRPTMTKVVARLEFVLALASQKHGGATIAEKVWSLFPLKIPAVNGKNYRLRKKWSDYNKSKRIILDKEMTEGSNEGKDNSVIVVDPTKPAAEGSNGTINKCVITEEPIMTAEERSSNCIKESANINKLATTAVECHDTKAQPSSRQMGTHSLMIFTFDEVKRATRNFLPSELLGVSDGASVYKGWVDSASYAPSVLGVGIAVAIKISNTDNARSRKEWQAELKWGRVSHPNLVKLLGYSSEGRMRVLIHGYIPNRNFLDIFHPVELHGIKTMKIAIGVAKGLAFLHTDKRTPLYRTFNASNILLNEDDEAQLYFGWASLSRVRGSFSTTRYNPPEYMATGCWYVKSDVYAFGVTMLDMIAGLGFLDNKQCSSPESLMERATPILSDNYILQEIFEKRLGQGNTPKGAIKVAELILNCLKIAPKNRPSMNCGYLRRD